MKQARILIVEDEFIARENLEHVLQKEGYETVALDSGVTALKELEKNEFDLVMTDLAHAAGGRHAGSGAHQGALPGHRGHHDHRLRHRVHRGGGHAKGAYHYLAKPYKIDEVRILVRQALEKKMAQAGGH